MSARQPTQTDPPAMLDNLSYVYELSAMGEETAQGAVRATSQAVIGGPFLPAASIGAHAKGGGG